MIISFCIVSKGRVLLSNIEHTIRILLTKVNISDPAERRKVYESAWNAQERYLIKNHDIIDNETRQEKRDELMAIIRHIEQEYRYPRPQAPKTKPTAQRPRASQNASQKPKSSAIRPGKFHIPYRKRKIGHDSRLVFGALWLLVLIILAFIAWSFYNSLATPPQKPEIVDKPALPKTVTRPVKQNVSYPAKWTRIFNPQDVTALAVDGSAKAQIINEDKESFVRITANSINDAAILNIGSGALDPLRGKIATIDIIARSSANSPSQLVVTCDFGGGNDCGRIRFEVPVTREDLLFNVTIPASRFGEGSLRITSDRSDEGKGVDIYGILIQSAQ